MKTILAFTILLLTAPSVFAMTVRSYAVRLAVHQSGGGEGSAVVVLDGGIAGDLTLPLGFRDAENIRLTVAPPGTRIDSVVRDGQTHVNIVFPAAAAPKTAIGFAFDVRKPFVAVKPGPGEKRTLPRGAEMFRHAFVNTQPGTIGTYSCEVSFPRALRAHAIREALPKPGKKESEPRVRLASIDGAPGARLHLNDMKQGDATSMQIELVPRAKSWGWIVAGLILSILYLVNFRDLVARKATHNGSAQE